MHLLTLNFTQGIIIMRMLMVEDDAATAQSMELMLKSEGFNVYLTKSGEEAIDLAKLYDYDLIMLDLNLPDISGYEVLRTIRLAKVKTPVIIVSGLAGIEDKVRGLGFGADDYLTKPFHKDELVARIHSVVRRSKGHHSSIIEFGSFQVNLDNKTLTADGEKVKLTGKEYQMMELLALRKGVTLTKEMFLNHLYGGMDEPELKIIDVFICKLRKKLEAYCDDCKNPIETIWGRGYTLRVDTKAKEPFNTATQTQQTKPASPRAAVNQIIEPVQLPKVDHVVHELGNFQYNQTLGKLFIGEKEISIPSVSSTLLDFILEEPGEVTTYKYLATRKMQKDGSNPNPAIMGQQARALAKQLVEIGSDFQIQIRRGECVAFDRNSQPQIDTKLIDMPHMPDSSADTNIVSLEDFRSYGVSLNGSHARFQEVSYPLGERK
jgi:two-component system cell cycle response regulator CtrA